MATRPAPYEPSPGQGRQQRAAKPSSGRQRRQLASAAPAGMRNVGKNRLSAAIARLDHKLHSLQVVSSPPCRARSCRRFCSATSSKVDDFFKLEEGQRERAMVVLDNKAKKLVGDMHYEARILAVIRYHADYNFVKMRKKDVCTEYLTDEQYLKVPPNWFPMECWNLMAAKWCTAEWKNTHEEHRKRRHEMKGPAHHQGSYGPSQYKEAYERKHGVSISGTQAWAYAHHSSASKGAPFDPTSDTVAYNNITAKAKMTAYMKTAKEVYGEDYNPLEHDIDGEVAMRAGGGRKHGRLWIGDSLLDSASTPTLSQIRARNTNSSPAIRPHPTASQIEMDTLKAQLDEQKRINEQRDAEYRAMAERQRALEEYMKRMVDHIGGGLPPLPPLPPLEPFTASLHTPGVHSSAADSNSPVQLPHTRQ